MKTTKMIACLPLVLLSTSFALPANAANHSLEWIRQLGTSSDDESYGVSSDGLGNVYISGYTYGSLGGTNAGGQDAFLSKYDSTGSLLWTKQLGTSSSDASGSVSSDGLGNVYISGGTNGSLGGTNAGSRDAFVSKYDATGSLLWTEQLGTSSFDVSSSVSSDGLGNVYISGVTYGNLSGPNAGSVDAFLTKYDSTGTLEWTQQLGTSSDDRSTDVSSDGLGNVYISGYTGGDLGGTNAGFNDAFLSKYDSNGTLQWTQQLGTNSSDVSGSVSSDGLGNVYISGYTGGDLGGTNAGFNDAFLSKYDSNGTLQWTQQLGTNSWGDFSYGVSSDGLGNAYISGLTYGNLDGINAGGQDAFLSKYDSSGTLLWTQQLGTGSYERSTDVSSDGLGNVYISGYTEGALGGTNAGRNDAFVVKFSDPVVPEPSTLLLSTLAITGLLTRRRKK